MTGGTFASRVFSVCKWFVPFPHLFSRLSFLLKHFAFSALLSSLQQLFSFPSCCSAGLRHSSSGSCFTCVVAIPPFSLLASFLTATAMTVSSIHVFRRPKRSALRDLCGCTVRFPTISPRTTCKGTADASTGQLQKARAHEGGCSESVLILGGNGSNKVLAAVSEADSHGRKTATTIFCHRPQCITNRVKACSYIFVSTKGFNTRKPIQPQDAKEVANSFAPEQ